MYIKNVALSYFKLYFIFFSMNSLCFFSSYACRFACCFGLYVAFVVSFYCILMNTKCFASFLVYGAKNKIT